MLRRDADAGIGHGKHRKAIFLDSPTDVDLAVFGGVAHGVADKIQASAFDFINKAHHGFVCRDVRVDRVFAV